jgi:hypothetical protein
MHDHIMARYASRTMAALGLLAPVLAFASEHNLGLPGGSGKTAYVAECGSCHIAYPPQLLSASGWSRLMGGLDKHFGVDASVDAATSRMVGSYLGANAGAERRFGANVQRISETAWFRREHDEVPASVWKSPQTKSAANCPACHVQAGRGDFSERGIRLPTAARP